MKLFLFFLPKDGPTGKTVTHLSRCSRAASEHESRSAHSDTRHSTTEWMTSPPTLAKAGVGLGSRLFPPPSGEAGSRLAVRVSARPAQGGASKVVEALLARVLGVPKSHVGIVRGHRSREKTAWVQGDPETLAAAALDLPELS
ncbi:MAG: hypothetical protein F4Y03_16060 [Alphaproteobacteria bacterium]|nr:hypothetical protein [Alphaproteobacteria bacterium]